MYHITYNGETDIEHGAYVTTRPSPPAPQEDVTEHTIAGRDGVLIERTGRYGTITVTVELNFYGEPEDWGASYRDLKAWLCGSGQLILGDDDEWAYDVAYINIKTTERSIKRLGKVSVDFVCQPYMICLAGAVEMSADDAAYNPYETCHPTYIITGSGTCVLTVNGNEFEATATASLTIDTDRQLAYNDTGEVSNADTSGDFEDLYLEPGDNTISITSGFGLTVIPNWRAR